MDRRLLEWFRRRTTPYTGDVFNAVNVASSEGGGDPPDGGFSVNPVEPPIEIPDDPDNPGIPADPADPIDVPDDPDDPDDPDHGIPGNPADPIPHDPDDPDDPDGPIDDANDLFVVVDHDLQAPPFTPGSGVDFNEYSQEPPGSTPSSFTDGFENAAIDRWLTVVRGSMVEANDLLTVTAVETANTPKAAALFVAASYTDKVGQVTLNGVAGNQYVLGRMTAAGNGYAIQLIGSGGPNNIKILRLAAWVPAVIVVSVSPITNFSAGDRLGISIVGSTIRMVKNGALVGSSGTDATYASGYFGFGGDSINQAWRDLRVS